MASSVATYLDVTQNAASGPGPLAGAGAAGLDSKSMSQAAMTLAAISDGAQVLGEISANNGLATPETVSALAWLAKADLIELIGEDNNLRAQLTPPAVAALQEP